MAFAELRGSDLIRMVQRRLGGYANAYDNDVILDVINEGKDKVWSILKSLSSNYFQASTQFSDVTSTNYFGPLTGTQREYKLPDDFRAIRFIEVVTTGYEDVEFLMSNMTTPEWKAARRASNQLKNSNGVAKYYYDIAEADQGEKLTDPVTSPATAPGGFEMVLAQFPETPLQLVVWYLRALPDIEADTILDQIVSPYSKYIANFAVEKCMKIVQDLQMSSSWLQSWRDDVITVAQSGGQINQADPTFVTDFLG